jgi:hypothetical protein
LGKESWWLDQHQFFWNIGYSPISAPLLTPYCKIEKKYACLLLTFLVYIHGSWTFDKPYGIKLRCYMKHLGRTTWELGEPFKNVMGTHWEQGKKQKIPPQDQCLVATMFSLHHLFLATFYLVQNFKILT